VRDCQGTRARSNSRATPPTFEERAEHVDVVLCCRIGAQVTVEKAEGAHCRTVEAELSKKNSRHDRRHTPI